MENFKRKSSANEIFRPLNKISNDQGKRQYKKQKFENSIRKKSLRKTTMCAPNYHIPSVSRHQYIIAKVKPHRGYKKINKKRKEPSPTSKQQACFDVRLMSRIVHPKNVFDSKFVEDFSGKEVGVEELEGAVAKMFGKGGVVGMRVLPDQRVQFLHR